MQPNDTARTECLNRRQTLLALLGAALVPACGGGSDVAGLSSGGTGSFTTGVIVGLGSVIVNGTRFDDSAATVTDNLLPSGREALQLGMVVRIAGSSLTAAAQPGGLATARASRIEHGSEWIGPVDSVDTAARRLTLLGQTVHLTPTTVLAGTSFDASLQGRFIEVCGFLNSRDNSLQATRIELKSGRPDHYRLSGTVRNLTATSFELGSALIHFGSTADRPGTLQNGLLVRTKLQTGGSNSAGWIAEEVRAEDYRELIDDKDEAEIEGLITAFTNSARFSVGGVEIDASRISPPTGLALGVRVEVKGSASGGLVIAREIEIESDEDRDAQEFEFHGTVTALDQVARTFVIRGYSLRYIDSPSPGATRFELNGRTWANGLMASVKARLDAAGDLVATQVEAES